LNSKPRLKQVRPSSPFRPLFDDLNRAVMDQSGLRVGPGLGMSTGPFGPTVSRTSQDYMWAVADGDIPGASADDDGIDRDFGKGDAFEMTVEFKDGRVRLVRAGPDDPTRLTVFNPAQDQIDDGTLIRAQKDFGLWVIIWTECLGSTT
jgi:hypothetical protein